MHPEADSEDRVNPHLTPTGCPKAFFSHPDLSPVHLPLTSAVRLTWTGFPPSCLPNWFEVGRPVTSTLSPHLQPPAMFHTTPTLCPGGGDRWLSHHRSKASLGQPGGCSRAIWLTLVGRTTPPCVCWPRLEVCREVTRQLSNAARNRRPKRSLFPIRSPSLLKGNGTLPVSRNHTSRGS